MTERERDEKIYKQSWKNAFIALPIFLLCVACMTLPSIFIGNIIEKLGGTENIILWGMVPPALINGFIIIWAMEKFDRD